MSKKTYGSMTEYLQASTEEKLAHWKHNMTTEHETAEQRLDTLMSSAFETNHPAMLDYVELKFELKRLRASLLAADSKEGFYEKMWKDVCSLQRGDAVGTIQKVERYYREQEAMHARVPTGTELAMDKAPTIGEALERMGWQIVPKEPTEKMTGEGWSLFGITPVRTSEIYKAMLAAAPKPE